MIFVEGVVDVAKGGQVGALKLFRSHQSTAGIVATDLQLDDCLRLHRCHGPLLELASNIVDGLLAISGASLLSFGGHLCGETVPR